MTRILRIGLVVAGTIVEERLVRDRGPVTIDDWTLFVVDGGRYALRFGAAMDGRVSEGEQVSTLAQLRARRAAAHGDHWSLPLSEHAHGKVELGELTVLFQFVTDPGAQPRPALPLAVRGTLAERIDPRLAVIVGASVVLHASLAVAAWMHDRPVERRQVRQAMASMEVDALDPLIDLSLAPALQPDLPAEPGAATAVGKTGEPTRVDKLRPPRGGGTAVEQPMSPEEAAGAAVRYAAALAAETAAPGGIDGTMNKAAPGGELDKQMRELKLANAKVEIGGGSGRETHGDEGPRKGTGTARPPGEPGKIEPGGDKVEKEPKVRIDLKTPKGFDETTLSPDAVMARIQSHYLLGLKRCQQQLLREDASARARVDLSFTVNEKGRTTSPEARSEFSKLSSCIEGQMTSWTFPAPEDEDHERTEASFAVTLALQPE